MNSMNPIENFTIKLIDEYVAETERTFTRSDTGAYHVTYLGTKGRAGVELRISAEGPTNQILVVRVRPNTTWPAKKLHTLELFCNRWNAENGYPKAYVFTRKTGNLEITTEHQLPINSVGIHQPLVNEFCRTTISASFDFWNWIQQEVKELNPPKQSR